MIEENSNSMRDYSLREKKGLDDEGKCHSC